MRYFSVELDFPKIGCWYLGDVVDHLGREIDTSIFFRVTPVRQTDPIILPLVGTQDTAVIDSPLRILIFRQGPPLAFTFMGLLPPVVTSAIGEIIAAVTPHSVERVPARVDGYSDSYEILNVVSQVDCMDHARSQVDWGPRPEPGKSWKPFAIYKLAIDPGRAAGHHFFRIPESPARLIVSEEMKSALENVDLSGIRFEEV